ncbi:MAG: OsmC family peroxiredoxin [Gammaproteobacteria bacterium]|nr:MAG: OsmC family peroxiredoxin [Gammaproteobacteria bacterium]
MTTQAVQLKEITMINGINLDILQETVGAIIEEPELGKCRFRATNQWDGGSKNSTSISSFYAAGEERTHKQNFVFNADEPPLLAGYDDAANPVEYLLHSLAACVTTTIVAHSAVKGVNIEKVECQLEGDIDVNGFLGLNPDAPKGYTDIRMNYMIKADVDDANELKELVQYSPVYNVVSKGVNVDVQIELA